MTKKATLASRKPSNQAAQGKGQPASPYPSLTKSLLKALESTETRPFLTSDSSPQHSSFSAALKDYVNRQNTLDKIQPKYAIKYVETNIAEEKIRIFIASEFGMDDERAKLLSREFATRVSEFTSSTRTLYKDRSDKSQTAVDFALLHYGPFLHGKGLYQNLLRKIDPSLMMALDNQFKGNRAALAAILPTKKTEVDERLRSSLGEIPAGNRRKRALTALAQGIKLPPPK